MGPDVAGTMAGSANYRFLHWRVKEIVATGTRTATLLQETGSRNTLRTGGFRMTLSGGFLLAVTSPGSLSRLCWGTCRTCTREHLYTCCKVAALMSFSKINSRRRTQLSTEQRRSVRLRWACWVNEVLGKGGTLALVCDSPSPQVSRVGACACFLQVEDYDRTPAQTRLSIAIEHAEPCKIRDYADGGRPLLVISRAMSEGNLAAQQAVCIRKKGVDEVRKSRNISRLHCGVASCDVCVLNS